MPDQWGRPTPQDWQRLGLQWVNAFEHADKVKEEAQYKQLYQKLADGEDLDEMLEQQNFDPDAVRKAKRTYYADKVMEWKVQRQEDLKALAKADSALNNGNVEEAAKILATQYEQFPNGETATIQRVVDPGTGKREMGAKKLVIKNENNPNAADVAYDLDQRSIQGLIDQGFAQVDPQTYLKTRMALNEERRQFNAQSALNATEAVIVDKNGNPKKNILMRPVKKKDGKIVTQYNVDGKWTEKKPEGEIRSMDSHYKMKQLGMGERRVQATEEGVGLRKASLDETIRHNKAQEGIARAGLMKDAQGDQWKVTKERIKMAADKIENDFMGVKPSYNQTKKYLQYVQDDPKGWRQFQKNYINGSPEQRKKAREMLKDEGLGFIADWLGELKEEEVDEFEKWNPFDWFGNNTEGKTFWGED